jgi:D-alanine-D-alanine ligase
MTKSGKKYRVLVLLDERLMPPEKATGREPNLESWRMEYDVISALKALGHEVTPLGVSDDLAVIRKGVEELNPHIAVNLLEDFAGSCTMAQNIVAFLELQNVQYTGCNPRGLMIAFDKALTKKILAYHRIAVPQAFMFPKKRRVRRAMKLPYPLLVKSLCYEGSVGISQASVVYDEEHLIERVEFIHRTLNTHAIAEQYVEGREIYVGVIGNDRLETLPPWELLIKNLPEGAPNIATNKVKWDLNFRKKAGVTTEAAKDLSPEQSSSLAKLCKRIYKLLELSGYARLDFRLRDDGKFFLIEANPNPNISENEDFARSAHHAGLTYNRVWKKILNLGMNYEYLNLP